MSATPSLLRRMAGTAVLAMALAGGIAHAQQGPKIEIVGGDKYDWGTVAPAKLTASVKIKNAGDSTLNISDVRPGCGCTLTKIDKKELAPGDEATVDLSLDATYRTGELNKTVTISSNDRAMPYKVLTLHANIKRSVQFVPAQYFILSDGKVGQEMAAQSVRILNSGDAPFTVSQPSLVNGNVKARFELVSPKDGAVPAGRSYEVQPGQEIEVKAYVTPQDARSVYGTVRMETTSGEYPSVDLSITGTMAQAPQQGAAITPQTNTPSVVAAPVKNH